MINGLVFRMVSCRIIMKRTCSFNLRTMILEVVGVCWGRGCRNVDLRCLDC